MRDCEKAAKHLHLPFQSGSDRILKAMNRGYTAESYLALALKAKELMPGLMLTSDVIVGFPGETAEDFEKTVQLIEKVGFTSLFTFIYSPREGTPAAKLPDPVSRAEKQEWFDRLLQVQEKITAKITASLVGQTLRVLCEGKSRREGFLTGRTPGNLIAEFEGECETGAFCDILITGSNVRSLTGKTV
jgi:tRNA-2-methylthio-N6-dimethylallyladenosine synthase